MEDSDLPGRLQRARRDELVVEAAGGESVGRVEVMRGSASSLYGNAGGGVVDLRSSAPMPVPLSGAVRYWNGAFASRRLVAKTSGSTDGFGYQANVTRTESAGYRDYSRQRMDNGFGRLSYDNDNGSYALDWLGVNTPVAELAVKPVQDRFVSNAAQAEPSPQSAKSTKTAEAAVPTGRVATTAPAPAQQQR